SAWASTSPFSIPRRTRTPGPIRPTMFPSTVTAADVTRWMTAFISDFLFLQAFSLVTFLLVLLPDAAEIITMKCLSLQSHRDEVPLGPPGCFYCGKIYVMCRPGHCPELGRDPIGYHYFLAGREHGRVNTVQGAGGGENS